MLKRMIAAVITAFTLLSFASCGSSDREKFTENAWESAVGVIEFKESGKVCYNFEPEGDSVSYYKLLPGKRINLYTEEGEALGMIFDYRFENGDLYIGDAKYTKSSLAEYAEKKRDGDSVTNDTESN